VGLLGGRQISQTSAIIASIANIANIANMDGPRAMTGSIPDALGYLA
jgi:hypothetical protein